LVSTHRGGIERKEVLNERQPSGAVTARVMKLNVYGGLTTTISDPNPQPDFGSQVEWCAFREFGCTVSIQPTNLRWRVHRHPSPAISSDLPYTREEQWMSLAGQSDGLLERCPTQFPLEFEHRATCHRIRRPIVVQHH
jgi:hypothetical protein